MSGRVPYAVHMHGALTGHFIGSVTRRVRHGPEPPPRCVNLRLRSYESDEAAAWRPLRSHTLRWVDQSTPRVDRRLFSSIGQVPYASRQTGWSVGCSLEPFRGASAAISGLMSRGSLTRGQAALSSCASETAASRTHVRLWLRLSFATGNASALHSSCTSITSQLRGARRDSSFEFRRSHLVCIADRDGCCQVMR